MSSTTHPFKNATIAVSPFRLSHTQQEVDDMKTLIKLSPLGPDTYENAAEREEKMGISMKSMKEIRDSWLEYDFLKQQDQLNAELKQYTAQVEDSDPKTGKKHTFDVHFVADLSEDEKAIPLVLLHGWPGMGLFELTPMIEALKKADGAPSLHLIIMSLPGYMYSSAPPLDAEFGIEGMARVVHGLMTGLGFKEYAAQGGDLGAFISRLLACRYDECKAIHVNFVPVRDSLPAFKDLELNEKDQARLQRLKVFNGKGSGYAIEHATRPSTIAFCLASSPIALAAWIGEKLHEWTDKTPTMPIILQWLSLYWLTQTFPTSIYPYRHTQTDHPDPTTPPDEATARDLSKPMKGTYVRKPMGYSLFEYELMPTPRAWAEKTGNMITFAEHEFVSNASCPLGAL
ncbi:hypothetical protein QFC24_000070 [Naganishia onofrii]|uniref:Uncharacterized protein n=1 Tax=Naganishia onofrii TaxID=1851511 RepID=A0ACC2XXX5_9TREE|nr:hypothetical protein QFC24_000070 [Naganishia onofrii]